MTAKHYKANCKARPNASRTVDARTLARINRVEDQLREVCRRRGVSFDALTKDTRSADAKALDVARAHLTGKAPATADESNHLAALAARNAATDATIKQINESNGQTGVRALLERALAAIR